MFTLERGNKMKRLLPVALLCLAFWFAACDTFVQNVQDPIDRIPDELLNSETQVAFLITGVEGRFAETHDRLTVYAGGLSDEEFFDADVPNATFPSFLEMDQGDIRRDNNSVDGAYNALGEARRFADDLLIRVADIGTFEDAELKQRAEYTGNLYGGLTRYAYATYFGLEPEQGGGVISQSAEDPGPFIASSDMYALALDKFQTALALAPGDYERRVVNALIARVHLYTGNTAGAAAAAAQGMVDGDDPFQSLHNVESTNAWYFDSGVGRTQFVADFRYNDYIAADANEANRLPLDGITGASGIEYIRQAKYPDRNSPINIMSWQENELMLAEAELNSNNAGALDRVNAVRASHGIDPLDALDLDALITERDKELFTTGNRLVDQRRFGRWHLGAGTWMFLPITEKEFNSNPNLGG